MVVEAEIKEEMEKKESSHATKHVTTSSVHIAIEQWYHRAVPVQASHKPRLCVTFEEKKRRNKDKETIAIVGRHFIQKK